MQQPSFGADQVGGLNAGSKDFNPVGGEKPQAAQMRPASGAPPTFFRSTREPANGPTNPPTQAPQAQPQQFADAPKQDMQQYQQVNQQQQQYQPKGNQEQAFRQPMQGEAHIPNTIAAQMQMGPGSNVSGDDMKDLQQVEKDLAKANYVAPKDGEFTSFPELHERTLNQLRKHEIKSLFPIQQQCFYPIFNREDLIARDLTGSGKTLAFALPVTEYLRQKARTLGSRKIQAIVLAPTRELAIQVEKVFQTIKHSPNEYSSLTVYGGVSIEDQTRELKRGVDIFVGTTGRVLDHIERGNIDFANMKTVVLDEADQMLKLGFKEDVDKILMHVKRACGKDLQICLFSATVPSWVRQVANMHMQPNPRVVDLAQNLSNKTAKHVQHLAISCPFHNRLAALADVLICYGGAYGKTIVFTQTKADANSLILSDKIKQDIEVMHGDIAQNQREVTMKRFKEGKFKVLVATDVASRGLDIPNVDLVIQIEPPKEVETYIHRSGRTARAGASGTCITFYTSKTKQLIDDIERQAGIKLQRVGIPQPEEVIRASATGILTQLEEVNADVLPMFEEAADKMIEQMGGNPKAALCKTLAYISGHYKTALSARSLITGQERQLTMKMDLAFPETYRGRNLDSYLCREHLERWWPQRFVDSIRVMRTIKGKNGVVFDIYEDQCDRFMDNFQHILSQEGERLSFKVERCFELPQLAEDEHGFGGQGWRNDNQNDNSSKGGYGGNGDSGNGGGSYGGGDQGFQRYNGNRGGGSRGGDRGSFGGGGRGGYDNGNSGMRGGGGRGMRGGNSYGGSRGGYGDNDSYNNNRGGDSSYGNKEETGNWRSSGAAAGGSYEQRPQTAGPSYSSGDRGSGMRGGDRGSDRGGDRGRGMRGGRGGMDQSYGNNYQGGNDFQRGGDNNSDRQSQPQYKPKENQFQSSSVFVSNLPIDFNEQQLGGVFQSAGFKVVKSTILYDQGKSKGAGFVELGSTDEVQQAIQKVNGSTVSNKRLMVAMAKQ